MKTTLGLKEMTREQVDFKGVRRVLAIAAALLGLIAGSAIVAGSAHAAELAPSAEELGSPLTLTVQSTPIAGVAITGDKPGTTPYPAACTEGESVTLAIANLTEPQGGIDYVFDGWYLDGEKQPEGSLGEGSVAVVVKGDHELEARYGIPQIERSSFLGGSGADYGNEVALDCEGNIIIVGQTDSPLPWPPEIPTPSVYGPRGLNDAFVAKVTPDGRTLLWVTILGGSKQDYGYGVAVDAACNIFVTGRTYSDDFHVLDAFDAIYNDASDAFVAKLDSLGEVGWSSFLGGSGSDHGLCIAVDADGNALIAGNTGSQDFPTDNGSDQTLDGPGDAFVVKISGGGQFLWGRYLGGSDGENGEAIAVDSAGNALITGLTLSADFPVLDGFDMTHNGGSDAFVAEVSGSDNRIIWASFLGGNDYDYAKSVAVDSAGDILLTGLTMSMDFPTPGGFDTTLNGVRDAFVAKVSSTGERLLWASFLGGSEPGYGSYGNGIVADSSDDAIITGLTAAADFPTSGGSDTTHNGSYDAFVTKVSTAGRLLWSSFLGGSGEDQGRGVAIDAVDNPVIVGLSKSADFPTTPGVFDPTHNGGYDAFITKLIIPPVLSVTSTPIAGITITDDEGDKGGTTGYTVVCNKDEIVNLTAPEIVIVADVEYSFVRWIVDGVDHPPFQAGLQITMDASHAAVAEYKWSPELCLVEAGTFTTSTVVEVYLDAYWIGKYEVANHFYCMFLNAGGNDAYWHDANVEIERLDTCGRYTYRPASGFEERPVRWVNWHGAVAFCDWLSEQQGLPPGSYHLPTEAQWEKAAGWDPDIEELCTYPICNDTIGCSRANYNNCVGHTTDVGSYHPWKSCYGCYGMSGNVSEWCQDRYGSYPSGNVNPTGPSSGTTRVARGGRWHTSASNSETGSRYSYGPSDVYDYIGFRIAADSIPRTLTVCATPITGIQITADPPDKGGTTDYPVPSYHGQVVELEAPLWHSAGGMYFDLDYWQVDDDHEHGECPYVCLDIPGARPVGATSVRFTVNGDNTALAVYHLRGDANRDCKVNVLDLIYVRNRLRGPVRTADNWQADLIRDDEINILDLIYVRNHLGAECEPSDCE